MRTIKLESSFLELSYEAKGGIVLKEEDSLKKNSPY